MVFNEPVLSWVPRVRISLSVYKPKKQNRRDLFEHDGEFQRARRVWYHPGFLLSTMLSIIYIHLHSLRAYTVSSTQPTLPQFPR